MTDKLKISWAAARVNSRLTQKEVCQKLHIGASTLVNWENGATFPPFDMCLKLSELYDIPLENIR